jgi:hypothetical protein
MTSEKQIDANRRNPTGAKTEEGRNCSRMNALRNSLAGQPAKDGFVLVNDQIHAAIDCQQRLERASATDFTRFKPRKFQTQAA